MNKSIASVLLLSISLMSATSEPSQALAAPNDANELSEPIQSDQEEASKWDEPGGWAGIIWMGALFIVLPLSLECSKARERRNAERKVAAWGNYVWVGRGLHYASKGVGALGALLGGGRRG